MKENKRVLTEIFNVTKNGANNMETLLGSASDFDIGCNIMKQVCDYREYAKKTGVKENKMGVVSNELTKMNLKTRVMLNPTRSHIASMAIRENEAGIVKIQRALNNNQGASPRVKTLAKDIIDYQKQTVDNYLNYL